MAAALSAVQSALAGLSPREKRLMILLGVVFGLIVFMGVFYWSSLKLDAIDRERADTVEALQTIQRLRPRIAARNARRDALMMRYRSRAPALTSFVEEQAHAATVQVAEAQDRPPAPSGQRFTERSVSIRLRQVSLQALADFMDRIVNAEFPVAITSIRIRKRFGEPNKYDVDDMVIATWDQNPAGSGARTNARGATNGGTARDEEGRR